MFTEQSTAAQMNVAPVSGSRLSNELLQYILFCDFSYKWPKFEGSSSSILAN